MNSKQEEADKDESAIDEKNNEALDKVLKEINSWIQSNETYTIRFGIGLLMQYYLDDSFKSKYLELVSNIKSDEYYVNMMIAWFFATALAKQYKDAVLYLENKKLDLWVHNKTIQKAIESNRISLERKKYLKSLKIKWYELVNYFFYNIIKPKYYNYLNYSLVSSIFIDKTILNEN